MKIRDNKFIDYFVWPVTTVFVFILFISGLLGKRLAASDFTPFSGNFNAAFRNFIYVWDGLYMGNFMPASFLQATRAIFELSGNAFIAQTLFLISIFLLGYFGIYKLFRLYKCSLYICRVIPFFYFFNPALAAELTNGATGAILICGLIPWLFFVVEKYLHKNRISFGLAFSFIVSLCLLNIQISFWIYLSVLLFLILKVYILGFRNHIRSIIKLVVYGLLGAVLNIIFLFTFFNYTSNFSKISYLPTFVHNYETAKLTNIFLLLGNNGSQQSKLGYYDSPVRGLFYIFIIIIFVSTLLLYARRKSNLCSIGERVFVFYSLVSVILITALLYLIKGGYLNNLILNANPIIVSLRSPIKLFYIYAFNFILLLGFSVNRLFIFLFNKGTSLDRLSKIAAISVLVVIYGLFNVHFFDGSFGLSIVNHNDAYYITKKYDNLNKVLISTGSEKNFLYLPFDYSIQLKLSNTNNIVKQKMGSSMLSAETGNPLVDLYKGFCERGINTISDNYNIQYVVLDKNPTSYQSHVTEKCSYFSFYGTPYIWGTYDYFNNLFSGSRVYYEDNDYKIYQVSSTVKPEVGSIKPSYIFSGLDYSGLNQFEEKPDYLETENISDGNIYVPVVKNIFDKAEDVLGIKNLGFIKNLLIITNESQYINLFRKGSYITILQAPSGELYINNKLLETNKKNTIKFSKKASFFEMGSDIFKFDEKNKIPLDSKKYTDHISILDIDKNIIENGSFEFGAWQKKVGDCKNIDSNGSLGMLMDRNEKSSGYQSLRLEAMRHVACVSTRSKIYKSGDYLLSFDYQSPNSKQAGFFLSFDDKDKTVIGKKIAITGTNWQTYTQKIAVPEGATKVNFYLYSYSTDGVTNIINRYDNVVFGKLKTIATINIPQNRGYEKIQVELKEGENSFKYKDDRYDYANELENGSFEDGLWINEVRDCHNYDKNPVLGMGLNLNEKTEGKQSLQLEAVRHTACTTQSVTVRGGGTYLMSFDYQSPNTKVASYYVGFDDEDKTNISETLQLADKTWHSFNKIIKAPYGATSFTLYVYAKETDGKTNVINRYDNFKLIEVPDLTDSYYLISEPKEKLIEPKSVTYDLINPTKKSVHISGATTGFFVGMSESYHPQWQLQVTNNKILGLLNGWWPLAKPDRVDDKYHYKLDGFLNAWYIDTNELCVIGNHCTKNADGSYDIDMTIEFWPQRWFYLGLLISGTTLAGCLGYLGYSGVRGIRRRRRLAKEKKDEIVVA